MDLHAVLGRAHRDLARVELGHGRFQRHAPALILQPRRTIREQPRGLDAGGVVDQLPANRLKRPDRPSELLALKRVVARRFVRALCQTDR